MTPDPFELAGEYVLGTLSAARRRELEQAMATDATLRAAVGYWEERLLPLTALTDPAIPSATLWPRIERSLGAASAPASTSASAAGAVSRWWDRLDLWRSLAAGGFAAAAIMAAVVGIRQHEMRQPRYTVVLAAPQTASPGWILSLVDDDTLRLEPLVRTAVPDQRALQLWTKADGWPGPVSLGLVKPGETVDVKLTNLPKVAPNQLFEITLEPATGSPIDRPTGPILYIGRALTL